ncbi:hypothetical protein FKW77_004099 [Venturia effusa]|uniref:BTB domain-containing protein n=1 Tax=Venturia effusa TaxID=50376 RepID=A0A517LNS6_9PEZI|nr:hypothetical protein FKW77_004099 [Venturia effusa]
MATNPPPGSRPFLQYPDGDVVISLAPNGLHDLILHSDVLSKFSDFFKTGLSDRWVEKKVTGTTIIAGKCVKMKRYELVIAERDDHHRHDFGRDYFLEGKSTVTSTAERAWPQGQYGDTVTAYKVAFALMYEDVEGPVELPHTAYRLFRPINAFMDVYQCYGSLAMCARLEALILGYLAGSAATTHHEACDLLNIGKALKSPDIWTEALKTAALGHYHYTTQPHCNLFPDLQDGDDQWALAHGYDPDVIPLVLTLSHAIWQHYEPIRHELLDSNVAATFHQHGLIKKLRKDSLYEANKIWKWWLDSNFDSRGQQTFWKLFTNKLTASDLIPSSQSARYKHLGIFDEVSEGLNVMLLEAQESVASLYEDIWEDAQPPMISRIFTARDPLPCIKTELAAEYNRILALRPQRLRIDINIATT